MRRLTWMLYNHRILMPEHLSHENYFAEWDGSNKIDTGYLACHLRRQPMQRTAYYMPWGVVTVDELSKMECPEPIDYWLEPDYEYGGF